MTHLESLVERIARLPGFNGIRSDPLDLIDVVNQLQAAGPTTAVATLEGYLRRSENPDGPDPSNFFLVCLAQFVPLDGDMPNFALGQPDLGPPRNRRDFPQFPLSLRGDLPLPLIRGYLLGGEGTPPGVFLSNCLDRGIQG